MSQESGKAPKQAIFSYTFCLSGRENLQNQGSFCAPLLSLGQNGLVPTKAVRSPGAISLPLWVNLRFFTSNRNMSANVSNS
jgi:hypothetical protein